MQGIKPLILGLLFIGTFGLQAQDAASILTKMDASLSAVKDRQVNMQMTLLNLNSYKQKFKEAVLWQKGADRKLFKYTAPESDAGISTLSLPNGEIYVYLPMFKTPKKMTNLAESNAFNKSDFSIEDMATQTYSDRFTPELVSSEGDIFTLKLVPKDPKYSWSYIVAYIDKEHYYHAQFDYHNAKGELEKQAKYQYTQVEGLWVTEQVSMEDFKKKHKTTLYMNDIKVNQGLSDDMFTVENMVVESPK